MLKTKLRGRTLEDYFQHYRPVGAKDVCWEWQGDRGHNYGKIWHQDAYGWLAHRWAYMQHHGRIDPNLVIRHTCDNPPCCNPSHLLEGTLADNVADRTSRNRHRSPPRNEHGKAKITTAQLLELRQKFASLPRDRRGGVINGHVKRLAQRYNLTPAHVGILGRT